MKSAQDYFKMSDTRRWSAKEIHSINKHMYKVVYVLCARLIDLLDIRFGSTEP